MVFGNMYFCFRWTSFYSYVAIYNWYCEFANASLDRVEGFLFRHWLDDRYNVIILRFIFVVNDPFLSVFCRKTFTTLFMTTISLLAYRRIIF